jgi:hypothetical protein
MESSLHVIVIIILGDRYNLIIVVWNIIAVVSFLVYINVAKSGPFNKNNGFKNPKVKLLYGILITSVPEYCTNNVGVELRIASATESS